MLEGDMGVTKHRPGQWRLYQMAWLLRQERWGSRAAIRAASGVRTRRGPSRPWPSVHGDTSLESEHVLGPSVYQTGVVAGWGGHGSPLGYRPRWRMASLMAWIQPISRSDGLLQPGVLGSDACHSASHRPRQVFICLPFSCVVVPSLLELGGRTRRRCAAQTGSLRRCTAGSRSWRPEQRHR